MQPINSTCKSDPNLSFDPNLNLSIRKECLNIYLLLKSKKLFSSRGLARCPHKVKPVRYSSLCGETWSILRHKNMPSPHTHTYTGIHTQQYYSEEITRVLTVCQLSVKAKVTAWGRPKLKHSQTDYLSDAISNQEQWSVSQCVCVCVFS